MGSLLARLVVLCCLLGAASQTAAHQAHGTEPYTVGVVPQFDARTIHRVWNPILKVLEQATGSPFLLRGAPSTPEFERQFLTGTFDFAYMNPYHLLMAWRKQGYLPLVRDHGEALYGVVVVRRKGPIGRLEDLAGGVLAFPSHNALGACMLVRAELDRLLPRPVVPIFVNTHSSVYLNVALGRTIGGGGVQKTLERQPAYLRDRLRILYRTHAVPPHPFSAHPRVDLRVRERVREAMLRLGETATGRAMLEKIPIKEIGPADIEDYRVLEAMGLERYYRP